MEYMSSLHKKMLPLDQLYLVMSVVQISRLQQNMFLVQVEIVH